MRTPSLADRQRAAADAKKAALERYRATLSDPGFAERQAVRRAIVAARDTRIAERRAATEARRAREAVEKAAQEETERAAREAARQAELAARQAAAEAKAARERELAEALLSTRKARKAARKPRSAMGEASRLRSSGRHSISKIPGGNLVRFGKLRLIPHRPHPGRDIDRIGDPVAKVGVSSAMSVPLVRACDHQSRGLGNGGPLSVVEGTFAADAARIVK